MHLNVTNKNESCPGFNLADHVCKWQKFSDWTSESSKRFVRLMKSVFGLGDGLASHVPSGVSVSEQLVSDLLLSIATIQQSRRFKLLSLNIIQQALMLADQSVRFVLYVWRLHANKKQGNLKKIVMHPIYVWFCYLFNGICFHFHFCVTVTGIPADLHIVHCLWQH